MLNRNIKAIFLLTLTSLLFANVHQATEIVGKTEGQFRVNESGAATYQLPINLPAGRAGVTPSIGLAYSSGNGMEGPLGVGWSVTGLSSITRCPATPAQDGKIDYIKYDSTDYFCLDGQRLELVYGSYGGSGSIYRTEIDSFQTIKVEQLATNGPKYFSVTNKAGETWYYGDASSVSTYFGDASDAFVQPGGWTSSDSAAKSWALKAIVDVKGNFIRFDYDKNTAVGTFYIDKILYTGHINTSAGGLFAEVDFVYQDYEKGTKGYGSGAYFNNNKILTRIDAKIDSESYRSYHLDYEWSDFIEERTLLTSIQECNDAAKSYCFKPLTFDWSRPALKSSGTTNTCVTEQYVSTFCYDKPYIINFHPFDSQLTNHITGVANHQTTQVFDINGDGFQDVIFVQNGYWKVKFGPNYNSILTFSSIGNTKKDYALSIDHDGDGVRELLVANSKTSNWYAIGYSRTGVPATLCASNDTCQSYSHSSNYYVKNLGVIATGMEGEAQVLDVNGDAMEDIVYRSGQQIKVHLNDSDGTFTTKILYTFGTTPSSFELQQGEIDQTASMKSASAFDVNGDGRSDLVMKVTSTESGCYLYGYLQPWIPTAYECGHEGGTWQTTTSSDYTLLKAGGTLTDPNLTSVQNIGITSAMDTLRYADLNGDGLTDLLYVSSNKWRYRLSDGTRLLQARDTGLTTNSTTKLLSQFVDLNADGRADILHATSTSNWAIHFSRPTNDVRWITFEKRGNQYFTSNATVRFGDYNGDGKIDLFTSSGSDKWTIQKNRDGIKEYAINKITDSYGVDTDITYNLLTDNSVYVMQASDYNTSYDTFSPVMPMHVVSEVSTESNVGSSVSVEYEYGGLLIHKAGRGMLGFQMLRTMTNPTDDQQSSTRVITETHYDQSHGLDFALAGMPRYTEQSINNKLLSKSQNTLSVMTTVANRSYFPYIQNSVESSYIYDSYGISTQVATTTTTNVYDIWGNLKDNTVTIQDSSTSDIIETITDNDFGTGSNMQFGRLLETIVTKKRTGQTDIVRETEFTYNTDNLLHTSTVSPNTTDELITTYSYDFYGNKEKVKVEGYTTATGSHGFRETETLYANNGRHLNVTKNALGEMTSFRYDSTPASYFYGITNSLTVIDPNNISVTTHYNKLGQKTSTTTPDNRNPSITPSFCNSSCMGVHLNAYIKVASVEGGKPNSWAYLDKWGRVVAKEIIGFNGSIVKSTIDYDSKGRVWREYEPGSFSASYTETSYDDLGRPYDIIKPNTGNITQTITGRTTITTNELGQETHVTANGFGETVETEDDIGSKVQFTYNAFSQLLSAATKADGKTSTITTVYDTWGRKTKTIDPIKGTWEYTYNAFGELYTQKTARLHTFTFTYDKLGRKIRSHEPNEGTLCWSYGSSSGSFGKLRFSYKYDGVINSLCMSGTPDTMKEFDYDSYGRLDTTTTSVRISGTTSTYIQEQDYDIYSRPTVTTYPMGISTFKTKQYYNAYNYPLKTVDFSTGTDGVIFQEIIAMDDRGQVTQIDYANGHSTQNTYRSDNGWLTKTKTTGTGFNTEIEITHDLLGNVLSRESIYGAQSGGFSGTSFIESYSYDFINRLTQRTFSPQSAPSIPSAFKASLDYVYDGFGNLKEKSDKGYYKYHSANVHELEGIYTNSNYTGEINTFVYDSSGNITDDGIRDFTYGSFDKPTYITKSSVNSSMKYGVNRELYFKEDNYSENGNSVNYKRTYLGTYEKVQRTGGAGNRIEHKYYVGNAVVTQSSNRTDTFYSYTDHQGSVVGTANQSGAHVSYAIYDPFGKRSEVYVNSLLSGGTFTEPTEKGYTGHIEMPEIGIIHMGGRIYDASIVRFLQADPVVQAPNNSQSYNRFAYVFNNPMTFTDPSGYSAWTKFRDKILRPVLAIVVAVYMPGTLLSGWGPVSSGALTGFVSGGIATGSLRGAVVGAITGAMFGNLHDIKGTDAIVGHAMTGGISSVLNGGKFGHGFFSAGFTKGMGGVFDKATSTTIRMKNAIKAALIGGTVSKLTGGKFGNGAVTGAFSRLLNDDADVFDERDKDDGDPILDPELEVLVSDGLKHNKIMSDAAKSIAEFTDSEYVDQPMGSVLVKNDDGALVPMKNANGEIITNVGLPQFQTTGHGWTHVNSDITDWKVLIVYEGKNFYQSTGGISNYRYKANEHNIAIFHQVGATVTMYQPYKKPIVFKDWK